MRPPIDGSVCVITGSSSGIGVELARLLAPRVRVLVLVARREDRLVDLAMELSDHCSGLELEVRPCDLSDVEATRLLAEDLLAEHGTVDLLINNAGLGDYELFEDADEEKLLTMMGVNMVGLTLLTRRLLPAMVAKGAGGVLNISSSFGLVWMPGFASYVGTKHYVSAFTDSLRCELLGTGVTVTQVCPGPVRTEFDEVAGIRDSMSVPDLLWLSAPACAESAITGFEKGRAMVVPGLLMKLVSASGSLVPRFLLRAVMSIAGRFLRLELQARAVMRGS